MVDVIQHQIDEEGDRYVSGLEVVPENRCPVCDRPRGVVADLRELSARNALDAEGAAFCWREWGCEDQCRAAAVDWRARALRAEARVAELEEDVERTALEHDRNRHVVFGRAGDWLLLKAPHPSTPERMREIEKLIMLFELLNFGKVEECRDAFYFDAV